MNNNGLILKAKRAMKCAYAPYSNFKVGAALMTIDGSVYSGVNIENSSYSLTCCAERVAIFKAVSDGHLQFKEMAIVGDTEEPISPCGACRQVMNEFFDENVKIYLANTIGNYRATNIAKLLPDSFRLEK